MEASSLDQELLDSGSKLYLKTIDGKDSDDYVVVLSKWNDAVRFELDDNERAGLQLVARQGSMSHRERGDLIRRIHVSMVAGWGGPGFKGKEFTPENVEAWIRANPQHAEAIDDRSSSDRFFTKASTSSSSGSGTSDD
jgi:hypothetical protein